MLNDQNEIPDADIHETMDEIRQTRNRRAPPLPVYPLKKKLVLAAAGATIAVCMMLFVNFFHNGITQERMKAVALADIIPSEPLPGDEELFDEDGVPEGKPRPSFFSWWYSTFGQQPAPTPVTEPNLRPILNSNSSTESSPDFIPDNNPTISSTGTPVPTPIAIPTPIAPVIAPPIKHQTRRPHIS